MQRGAHPIVQLQCAVINVGLATRLTAFARALNRYRRMSPAFSNSCSERHKRNRTFSTVPSAICEEGRLPCVADHRKTAASATVHAQID
jgi:hypothetical protein